MEQYSVNVSEPAENDLRDIARYISAEQLEPATALKVIDAIEEALKKLAYMPQRYPPIADRRLTALGYRKLIVKNYIVFFTINEKDQAIDVERILHARRDWLRILQSPATGTSRTEGGSSAFDH